MHARQYCIKKPLFTYQRCLNNCQCLSNSQNLFLTQQSSSANSASSLRSSELLMSVFCIFAVTKILNFAIIYSSTGGGRYELWSSHFVNQLSISLALHIGASWNPQVKATDHGKTRLLQDYLGISKLGLAFIPLNVPRGEELKIERKSASHANSSRGQKGGSPAEEKRRGGSRSPVILGGKVNLAAQPSKGKNRENCVVPQLFIG